MDDVGETDRKGSIFAWKSCRLFLLFTQNHDFRWGQQPVTPEDLAGGAAMRLNQAAWLTDRILLLGLSAGKVRRPSIDRFWGTARRQGMSATVPDLMGLRVKASPLLS